MIYQETCSKRRVIFILSIVSLLLIHEKIILSEDHKLVNRKTAFLIRVKAYVYKRLTELK